MPLPSIVSESTRRLNPGLFGGTINCKCVVPPVDKPRLRQARGPKLNKTEEAFFNRLRLQFPSARIKPHGVTLLLANGCRYTPDFHVEGEQGDWVRVYEVKGPHAWDDSIVKLKVAATSFLSLQFWLVSKRMGTWREERVLP